MPRLSRHTLSGLTAGSDLALPVRRDVPTAPPGIVHFGIGAFHRAHQAFVTQVATESDGDDRWGICGVTQRSDLVKRQLVPQDGLYSILERSPERTRVQVVGSVHEVLAPAEDHARLQQVLAAPSTRVVTLTVTEKGYRRGPDGHLDLSDPVIAADLQPGSLPGSAIGRLVRGLQRRAETSGEPISVVSCDNLTGNGDLLQRLVADFCGALPGAEGRDLVAWVGAQVSFPSTMVDRIAPATTEADRALAAGILGCEDQGLVVAEPFLQWVIEDAFVAERPAWERGGAQLVANVAPFELMKLRILNGTHSTLAYLGALRGYPTIARAVADPELLEGARALIVDDVIPTLTPPEDTDLAAYGEQVLERFANPALAHTTVQVAMDGSQKLPLRLLGTIRDGIARGHEAHGATVGVAGWMAYLASERAADGMALPVDDPMAPRLTAAVRGRTDAAGVVETLLRVEEIFGQDLPSVAWFRDQLVTDVDRMIVR